jgi:asparagine synthase (glutamine-hydrolysing)
MCAINGFTFNEPSLLKKMMHYCKNRGPDWADTYHDTDISLGHNRLSILDIDNRSNQPFVYENLVLSFNGEIYNYLNLKKLLELNGYNFLTTSDTEVLIKLFHMYGAEAFKKLSGIFSISLWDRKEKTLYLIRDILGVKPLYYKQKGENIFFSTLIKPLLIEDNYSINLDAVNYYSNFGYNDLNETFYKGIFKILPGELLIYKNKKINKKKYLNFNFKNKISDKFIKEKISSIIKKQSISDVPISIALSGGIDSNILLSNIEKNLKSYSVSFSYMGNKNLDAIYAAKRAKKFNINHNEISISDDDFFDSLEKINDLLEEPIGNQNSVSNYFLSKIVKEKVLFVGDGGDEIFTGYNKYRSIFFLCLFSRINFFKFLKPNFKTKKFKRFFFNNKEMYLSFSNQNLLINNNPYKYFKIIQANQVNFNNFNEVSPEPRLEKIMLADIDTWVQNDILLRNDKIYMNEGIEVRVPFLDQEMIENFSFYSSLKKINFFSKTKPLLRNLFAKELKGTLNSKKGFNGPFNLWIKEEKNINKLKFFFSKEYYQSDLIDYTEVSKLLNSRLDNSFRIFSILMFQIFLKKNNF